MENNAFLWEYLQSAKKPIVMYGTGDGADKILSVMAHYELKPACFTASGDFGMKPRFRDYEVLTFDETERRFGDFIVLICFGSDKSPVLDRFYEIAQKHEVYAPDMPVVGEPLENFTPDYIEKNRDNLEKVRKMLADDRSKKVFDGWLDYRLSGKIDILESISTPRAETISLLKLKQDEFFIDAGAFNGDTVEEFITATSGKFTKIIAIEPDIKNYTALRRKFYAYGSGIFKPINAAAWNADQQVEFIEKSGKAGTVGAGSSRPSAQINGMKIDTICGENKPTYIKIDVEGAEQQVLQGAKSVITKHKPKMIVSLYHRTEDMHSLPILIHSMNQRYKFYLRKTRCLPGWEFNLIVV